MYIPEAGRLFTLFFIGRTRSVPAQCPPLTSRLRSRVSAQTSDSLADPALSSVEGLSLRSDTTQAGVLALFDECAPALLRYVATFGLSAEETEDVVQDTFVALFRHLSLGRDRTNLQGWLFRVAHNQALKRRERLLKQVRHAHSEAAVASWHVDPALDPEARLIRHERHRRLRSVFNALPARERHCLFLRVQGLTYRDIAQALSVSLGSVSKAVTRATTRLLNADGGK
jgi:RNA polymerase sigma-70 factor (ECF subfamily)